MQIRILTSETDLSRYSDWVLTHPQGNLWQSVERKKYVEACGKKAHIYVAEEESQIVASALVVIDRTIGGYTTWEIPRGPLWKSDQWLVGSDQLVSVLIEKIINGAKEGKCMSLYLSPTTKLPASHYSLATSPRRIHAQATRIVDLRKSEEQILAGMHPKGRYNIGVARKHGVEVVRGTVDDIDAFYSILIQTGVRDRFHISQKSHYARFLTALEGSFLLLAKHEGRAIAGLIGVVWPSSSPPPHLLSSSSPALLHCGGEGGHTHTGIYYYGASSYEHRHLMAPYLLQWEAMRHCKAEGCTRYDLLGISPEGSSFSDPWMGITEFKSKFGGEVVSYPQEQMIVLRPIVKRMLEWKRRVIG